MLTTQQLVAIMPLAKNRAPRFIGFINEVFHEFYLDNVARQASFLAQVAHESGQMLYLQELASGEAYEGRKDLGNTQPGDGRKFRGHGLLQVTGRYNHEKASVYFGKTLDDFLIWVVTDEGATRVSGWWWADNHMNEIADTGDELRVSRAVNLGNPDSKKTPNGLAQRLAFKVAALKVLGEAK